MDAMVDAVVGQWGAIHILINNAGINIRKRPEDLLEEELSSLGVTVDRVSPLGVFAQVDLRLMYHLCLWSRLANRILLPLFKGEVNDVAALSQLCAQFDWSSVFSVDRSIAIDYYGESRFVKNTM